MTVPDPSLSPRTFQVRLTLLPGARSPTVTELPGLTSLSRLFGATVKLSCAPVIVEPPVLVRVTVNEVLSPRSNEAGPVIETEPRGGAALLTVTVTLALAVPLAPVAVSV